MSQQFVPFRDYMDRTGNHVLSMARLAKDVLAEIPDQLISYMKSRGIKPNQTSPDCSPAMLSPTNTIWVYKRSISDQRKQAMATDVPLLFPLIWIFSQPIQQFSLQVDILYSTNKQALATGYGSDSFQRLNNNQWHSIWV